MGVGIHRYWHWKAHSERNEAGELPCRCCTAPTPAWWVYTLACIHSPVHSSLYTLACIHYHDVHLALCSRPRRYFRRSRCGAVSRCHSALCLCSAQCSEHSMRSRHTQPEHLHSQGSLNHRLFCAASARSPLILCPYNSKSTSTFCSAYTASCAGIRTGAEPA